MKKRDLNSNRVSIMLYWYNWLATGLDVGINDTQLMIDMWHQLAVFVVLGPLLPLFFV